MTGSFGDSDTDYGLIKYTATKDMEIQKIGTYVNTAGSNIEVEIFDDFDGSSLSGSLGSISNQICDYPGYYTFNLSSGISITSGNDFYIRVKYNTPGCNTPVPFENMEPGYSSNATIETGKCWISSNGTSNWLALGMGTDYENDLCIKAYTLSYINNPPVLSSVTDQTTDEDMPITLDMSMVTVSDVDGDSLNIVVLDGNNYSVTDSTVTPDTDFTGDLTVPVYVTDQTANSDTLDMTINVGSTGFDDDINNSGITIYPNPVKNIINVNYDKEFSMEIYNVLGEIILISKHAETNVSSLPTGIYIIIIKDKENKLIKYKKVVKE